MELKSSSQSYDWSEYALAWAHRAVDINNLDVLPSLLQVVNKSVDRHHDVTLDVICLVIDHPNGPVEA